MTLEDAIKHAEEVASRKFDDRVHCIKCAEEHRQLAEWLKELKRHREAWDKIKTELNELIEWHDCPIEYDGGNDAWYRTAIEMAVVVIDKALGEVGEQDGCY